MDSALLSHYVPGFESGESGMCPSMAFMMVILSELGACRSFSKSIQSLNDEVEHAATLVMPTPSCIGVYIHGAIRSYGTNCALLLLAPA